MRRNNLMVIGILTAALSNMATAAVILDFPDVVAGAGTTFTFDAVFHISPSATVKSLGYQVAFSIDGPDNKLTITGAALTGLYGATPPLDFVAAPPTSGIYTLTGFVNNPVNLIDGSVLTTFTAQLAAGATGVYQLNWYQVAGDPYESMVLDGVNGDPLAVTFANGSVAVPEAGVVTMMLGIGSAGGLLRRRRLAQAAK